MINNNTRQLKTAESLLQKHVIPSM